ncbi:TonB-dependent hemoglobin/transferrin/lactoferrin family receptor [Actinobacillus equuli]|uniref:TonB-dependent hemoglobin/transferrin/lactoferrin family receptor n=1 Tax=Actinobacillus equuli TaxID=718 RepID=UPI002442F098|nr:TonB-dependent hemoglobin/transferrin/lactoferrin family receptor [Actinobacillus equuli]WGE85819.1 TonB-dependent hemoglobin/transferrin/lactoferrin family receptor [Actinobacillus equuli subsp. haemolyticus]
MIVIKFRFNLSVAALCVLQYSFALAQEQVQLDTVIVKDGIQQQKISEIKKSAKQLAKQQVQDSRDLVRYETGVTVVETGRMGSSGYAVRGVDENRVAITVDGLHQAETLSSQGFKELFEGYGNFNNTRNSVEIETLKQATIRKGADSVRVGSGALGGAVMFETKDARDFLTEKDYHFGYKTGYSSADNQKANSLTFAGRYKNFDILALKTWRDGHELENYDYKTANGSVQGKEREKADPYSIKKDSSLIKFGYSPSDNHRISVVADLYEKKNRGHDFSYNLKPTTYINVDEYELRHTNDKSKRQNYAFVYENFSANPLWDTLKLTYSTQKIKNRARTDDYCDGAHCKETSNPAGLQLKDGKVVDRDGNQPKLGVGELGLTTITDSKGTYTEGVNLVRDYWFDCSVFDCNKSVTAYKKSYDGTITSEQVALDKTYTDEKGRKFAAITNKQFNNVLLPESKGYTENIYTERDLDTNTKQVNLDLTKSFSLFEKEHSLEYGGSYAHTEKKMVNRSGFGATSNSQWWAKRFLGMKRDFFKGTEEPINCKNATGSDQWNGLLCPNEDTFSFLIPVEAKNGSLYFADNLKANDYLSFDIGYRYDDISYQPKYVAGQTAKIPDDMLQGLFVPLPERPSKEQIRQNAEENIKYLSRNVKYQKHSYSLAATADPFSFLRVQVKYANGFRAPTSDELYFTFKHPDFSVLPNVDLKAERAETKEAALTLHSDLGFITTSYFKTDYDNFIDLKYLGPKNLVNAFGGSATARPYQIYQNVNRQDAKVNGLEINSKLNFGQLWQALEGFNVSYKYTYQKGKMEGNLPLNAIQPRTSVFGLGYEHPEDKFGVDVYVTRVSAKKAEDTYNMYHSEEKAKDSYLKWRSDAYTLLDMIAYVKPWKNVTLQAGVYNLQNRKYLTWESVRSIRPFGTSNLINQATGKGLNRFTAPGRNFKLTAEVTF